MCASRGEGGRGWRKSLIRLPASAPDQAAARPVSKDPLNEARIGAGSVQEPRPLENPLRSVPRRPPLERVSAVPGPFHVITDLWPGRGAIGQCEQGCKCQRSPNPPAKGANENCRRDGGGKHENGEQHREDFHTLNIGICA